MPLPTDEEVLAALQDVRDAQAVRVAAETGLSEAQQDVEDAEAAYRRAKAALNELIDGPPAPPADA